MSEVLKLLLALWLLVYFPDAVAQNPRVDDSHAQAKASEKQVNGIMQGLYSTLRSIAQFKQESDAAVCANVSGESTQLF